ncbi:MAG: hypothetical protein IJZ79_04415 [Bacilli bacterium]|nr:hypothetical protein [Bacilli bacterium]
MKKKIIGIIIPVFIAMICGYICGKFVYNTYKDNIYNDLRSSKLYLIESGTYDSYDEMRYENNGNNYVYYLDDEGYKTVVGITRKYDNIDKIKSLYTNELSVDEYYVSNEYMNNDLLKYDEQLYSTSDIYEVKEVVDNILNLYRSDNGIKLISIE